METIDVLKNQLIEHNIAFDLLDRKLKVLHNEIEDDELEAEVIADLVSGQDEEDLIEDDREEYLNIVLSLEDIIKTLSEGKELDSTQSSFLASIGIKLD